MYTDLVYMFLMARENEGIWLSPMTKALTPAEMSYGKIAIQFCRCMYISNTPYACATVDFYRVVQKYHFG